MAINKQKKNKAGRNIPFIGFLLLLITLPLLVIYTSQQKQVADIQSFARRFNGEGGPELPIPKLTPTPIVCWNRTNGINWPNSCKGRPSRTNLLCAQRVVPLTASEKTGYKRWVSTGKPFLPGCGMPTPKLTPTPIVCWNRVWDRSGEVMPPNTYFITYSWPSGCKGNPKAQVCTQAIVPLTTSEKTGYKRWVSTGKPFLPGCGMPTPIPTKRCTTDNDCPQGNYCSAIPPDGCNPEATVNGLTKMTTCAGPYPVCWPRPTPEPTPMCITLPNCPIGASCMLTEPPPGTVYCPSPPNSTQPICYYQVEGDTARLVCPYLPD